MTTKALGSVDFKVHAVKEANRTSGEWEAVLSAPTLDRDNEIIDAGAFNPLPAKIPIDTDHDMRVGSTIGSGIPFYDGNLLKIRGVFASTPKAQEVRTLVREGHIDKMSVTFAMATREKAADGKTHIRSAELLNAAFVVIPSNREAAVLAAKGYLNRRHDVTRIKVLAALAEAEAALSMKRSTATSSKDPRRVLAEAERLLRHLGAKS